MSNYASYDRSNSDLLGINNNGPTSGYIKPNNSRFSHIAGESPYQDNNNSYKSVRQDLSTNDEYGGMANRLNKFDSSSLSREFFGRDNIARIQKQIKKEINKKSKGKFVMTVDQNENNLLVAMNEIYEKYSENLPTRIRHQTKRLNCLVVSNIVPDMITQIKQQYRYIQEISTPIQPMMRPVNVNGAGRNTLPAFSTVW
jgi:hypothetical protein